MHYKNMLNDELDELAIKAMKKLFLIFAVKKDRGLKDSQLNWELFIDKAVCSVERDLNK